MTTRLFYNLTKIESLDLSHNPIGEITPQNAIDLRSLHQLYLVDCQLKQLHSLFYYNFPKLKILDLRDNLLEEIHGNEFALLKELDELYLNGNRLINVAPNAFNGNTLTILGLSDNLLTELHVNTFGNSTVIQLDISDNNFTSFEPRTLHPLANCLKILKVNNVPSLKAASTSVMHLLASLKKLEHVQLSNINLDSTTLSTELFASHRNTLRHFNLSHNNFVNLSSRLLEDLDNLEVFDLSHNTLYELSAEVFYVLSKYPNLTYVFLDNNPWSCYRCHLLYFRNWIVTLPNAYDNACQHQNRCAECKYPENLEGVLVHEMEEWQLVLFSLFLQQKINFN